LRWRREGSVSARRAAARSLKSRCFRTCALRQPPNLGEPVRDRRCLFKSCPRYYQRHRKRCLWRLCGADLNHRGDLFGEALGDHDRREVREPGWPIRDDRGVDDTEPLWVPIEPPDGGVRERSFAMCDAVRSVSIERLESCWGSVERRTLARVEDGLRILLDL
jgi:hypothetical protein